MEIISDTSFLMILCYEPVKNMDFLESKFGKLIFLIHPEMIKELTQIKHNGNIKRSKIASLSLEIINKEIKNKNFKYLDMMNSMKLEITQANLTVDSHLLILSLKKNAH